MLVATKKVRSGRYTVVDNARSDGPRASAFQVVATESVLIHFNAFLLASPFSRGHDANHPGTAIAKRRFTSVIAHAVQTIYGRRSVLIVVYVQLAA